jgi:integrase/recombinase XerD
MSTPIRAKFIEHMEFLGLSKQTQRSYINGVKGLAKYHNESPEKLTNDQVRSYFRHLLLERKLARSTCGSYLCGITYFYKHLCNREVDDRFGLPSLPRSKKLPQILSMEEVSRLLSCAANLKQRVLLKTIYSAGLRVSEAIRLKPEHIESDPSRMMLRIEQGKGRKDRYTVLSERLLCELREYWQKYSPGQWLFPGQKPNSHITATSVSRALYRAKKKLRLPRRAACIRFDIHLLRIFYTTATTSIPSANFLVTPQ